MSITQGSHRYPMLMCLIRTLVLLHCCSLFVGPKQSDLSGDVQSCLSYLCHIESSCLEPGNDDTLSIRWPVKAVHAQGVCDVQ